MRAITASAEMLHRIAGSLRGRRHRDHGASLVEYALLVALIAVVCVAAVSFFGGETSEKFSVVARSVEGA